MQFYFLFLQKFSIFTIVESKSFFESFIKAFSTTVFSHDFLFRSFFFLKMFIRASSSFKNSLETMPIILNGKIKAILNSVQNETFLII